MIKGFQIRLPSPSGYDATFWSIQGKILIDYDRQILKLTLNGFKDEQAFDNSKVHVDQKTLSYTGEKFPYEADQAHVLLQMAYVLIKTEEAEFQDANIVEA